MRVWEGELTGCGEYGLLLLKYARCDFSVSMVMSTWRMSNERRSTLVRELIDVEVRWPL